jgi:amino acid transporter
MSTRDAAFIGVGAMVGAGIFSLLGAVGEVAGSAAWLSFVLAGIVAALQGYSFGKLGARYPSAGGLIEYVSRSFGDGHVAAITAWLAYAANIIVTALVAVSFGSYGSAALTGDDATLTVPLAVAIVVVMTALNLAGSTTVSRVQNVIVFVVVGILATFAVVTILNIDPARLAPSTYPNAQHIVSGVALTFFAFLGFGVVTFTAKDLREPGRQLPRAMTIAIGTAAVIYVAVALGVFGTLSVEEVIASGATAIAVAAQPVLGNAGYWLMLITALFATAGATNAGLYPLGGLAEHLASTGQFPPLMGGRIGGRAPVGLIVAAVSVVIMIISFDLSSIASIGSAVALMIFALVTGGHLRVRHETGARTGLLVLGLATTLIVLVTFAFTTLVEEPASITALFGLLILSIALDLAWSWQRERVASASG